MIEEFSEWIDSQILENSTKFVETIKFIDDYCRNNNKNISLLQDIDNVTDFVEFNQKIVSDKNFCLKVSLLKCYDDVNNTLITYCNFLNLRHNPRAKPIIISEILNIEFKDFYKIEKIFKEDFKLGFRINSIIDNDRFKKYYSTKFETDFSLDIDTVGFVVMQVGLFCGKEVYCHYDSIVSQKKLTEIKKFIESSLGEASIVYYNIILKHFDGNLEQIYDIEILKNVLYFFYKKEYCFYKDYLAKENNIVINKEDEIKRLLIENILPMDFIAINTKLPHISIEDIKKILKSNNEFISYKFDIYTHIDCIDITDSDLNEMKTYIDNKIEETGYVICRFLFNDFEIILNNNPYLTIIGFASLLKYFFVNQYFFQKSYLISAKDGDEINYITLLGDYCRGKDEVSLIDLDNFAKSIESDLSTYYLGDIFESFIQISSKTLINKNNINFNIIEIDNSINNILNGDYVTISQFETFSLLPNCGYPWNEYLLKSFVTDYSELFNYLSDSKTIKKCAGVIIRKDSLLKKYDDILIDAIIKSDIGSVIDENTVLAFLKDNGLVNTRGSKSLNNLIRLIQEKKK